MWHVSLHKPWKAHQVRVLRIQPGVYSPAPSLVDRRYLVRLLPIPFARLALFEVDVWRPLTARERELRRNRPMDGEIGL